LNTLSSYTKLLLAAFSIITLALLSGCGGGSAPITLNSIAVTPNSITVTHGETATLGAIGTYTDGSIADLTNQVTWASAASGTAAVSSNGVVSGAAVGNTTVTAALNGVTSPAASITVTAATLKSIAITPTSKTLPKGASAPLIATGTYSDGSHAVISTQVTWHSASIATATVGTDGSVKGVEVGSTTVFASMNSITSPDANITVTDAVLTSISITASATLPKGTTANLIATGTYSDSTTANITTQVTWTSNDPLTATVGSHTGIVFGTAIGSTSTTAVLGSITSSNTTDIHVIAATLSSIAVTPVSTTLAKGTSATLTATGTYSDGSHVDISTQVTWHSASIATATVGSDGTVTGVELGSTKAYASSNSINSPNVDIAVTPAILSSIAVTPSPATLAKGASTNLKAIGTFSDSTTEDITTKTTWTSDASAIATVGTNTGIVTGVAVGSTKVSALFDGVLSPIVSITVTPVTWNPADMGTEVYLTDANLTAKSTATWYRSVRATVGVSSGKAYWEITPIYSLGSFGIMGPSANLENWVGNDAYGWGIYPLDGTLRGTGQNSGWVATPVPYGAVIGFGLDMGDGTGTGTLSIWVDGVYQGIAFTGLTGTIYPASTIYAEGVTANFGATPFVTNPLPAGYNADVFQD
jgi:uncharacterized protein YjdB